jgi:hypothetical protein
VAYANSLDTVGILGTNTSSVRDIFGMIASFPRHVKTRPANKRIQQQSSTTTTPATQQVSPNPHAHAFSPNSKPPPSLHA